MIFYETIAAGLGVSADIHVPTDTLVRYHHDWEGPLMGDKTWAAIFDSSKVKRVTGDFTAVKNLGEVLAEPIARFKSRLQAHGPRDNKFDPLVDRIAGEQRSLGN